MNEVLLEQLRQIVGATNVLSSGDLTAYERDWRGWWAGRALAVVRPKTTSEVADVVKACRAARVSIVPQGGNTGLVEGAVPDKSGTQVVMQMVSMNAVREIDAANTIVTRRDNSLAGLAAACLGTTSTAWSEDWPARPIKFIVPWPAGDATDVASRIVSEKLAQRLKQHIVIDNKPGAAGVIGTLQAVKSQPDGYKAESHQHPSNRLPALPSPSCSVCSKLNVPAANALPRPRQALPSG